MKPSANAAHYLKARLKAIILGLVCMIVMANIPYHFWEKFAVLGYVVSAALIPVVLTPLGVESHGARRWIRLPRNRQSAACRGCKAGNDSVSCHPCAKMGKNVRTMKGFILMVLIPLPHVLMVWKIADNLDWQSLSWGFPCSWYLLQAPITKSL